MYKFLFSIMLNSFFIVFSSLPLGLNFKGYRSIRNLSMYHPILVYPNGMHSTLENKKLNFLIKSPVPFYADLLFVMPITIIVLTIGIILLVTAR